MDGVITIDKPQGLTSHDVVARVRRVLGEKRIGHTGTLDPLATGVLPLVCGRATRLARFLAASTKDYDATIRFGVTTDSYDITGAETSRSDASPSREELTRVLDSLVGEHRQTPPAYSAKRVAGQRAYDLARRHTAVALTPVLVTLSRAELIEYGEGVALVRLTCSAGFYVRALANLLGERAGTGACLEALRRTRSGDFGLDSALTLDSVERDPQSWVEALVPLQRLLPSIPIATVNDEGRSRIAHGRQLEPHVLVNAPIGETGEWVRVFGQDGALLALANPTGPSGSLHPSVVLI